jgi:hypothetical protein
MVMQKEMGLLPVYSQADFYISLARKNYTISCLIFILKPLKVIMDSPKINVRQVHYINSASSVFKPITVIFSRTHGVQVNRTIFIIN